MKLATILKSSLKIVVLTLALMILNIIGTMVTGLAASVSTEDPGSRLLAMLVVSLIETLLLSYFVVRSRLSGFRLIMATALIYYGIKTFTAQLETAYFVTSVPRTMLPALFLMTVPAALVFPPLACLLFGRLRPQNVPATAGFPSLPPAEWIWKALVVGIVVYPVLFFGAGYFIAWRNPDVRAFYGGVDNPNVFAYYANMFAKDPVVYPFEIIARRALVPAGAACDPHLARPPAGERPVGGLAVRPGRKRPAPDPEPPDA